MFILRHMTRTKAIHQVILLQECKLNVTHSNLRVYTAGPDPTFSINAAGNAVNQRSFRVTVNGTQVVQQTMDYYDYVKFQTSFPISALSTGTALVSIINDGTASCR